MVAGVEREEWQGGIEPGGFLARFFQRYFQGSGSDLGRRQDPEAAQGPALETASLSGRELRVLEISRSATISCLEGMAWVTFPRRFCDYVLQAGESLSLRGAGRIVVSGGCRKCVIRISGD